MVDSLSRKAMERLSINLQARYSKPKGQPNDGVESCQGGLSPQTCSTGHNQTVWSGYSESPTSIECLGVSASPPTAMSFASLLLVAFSVSPLVLPSAAM